MKSAASTGPRRMFAASHRCPDNTDNLAAPLPSVSLFITLFCTVDTFICSPGSVT